MFHVQPSFCFSVKSVSFNMCFGFLSKICDKFNLLYILLKAKVGHYNRANSCTPAQNFMLRSTVAAVVYIFAFPCSEFLGGLLVF